MRLLKKLNKNLNKKIKDILPQPVIKDISPQPVIKDISPQPVIFNFSYYIGKVCFYQQKTVNDLSEIKIDIFVKKYGTTFILKSCNFFTNEKATKEQLLNNTYEVIYSEVHYAI